MGAETTLSLATAIARFAVCQRSTSMAAIVTGSDDMDETVAPVLFNLAVRVSSTPLQRRKIQTSLPIGTPRSFTLMSIPFYLVSEIPRLVGAIRKG
jgi:hypothetical protein